MTFEKELEFEKALVELLPSKGWSNKIIEYPTEKDLIKNWANILFKNNNTIDRLNNIPLTDGEMGQIIEQIVDLRTPLKLNNFINGKVVSIIRDNPDDKLHFGKEISLKIYDRMEISGGDSFYQIVRQPKFAKKSKILNNRRGDLMLLINGMPVIHIELKASGIPVSQAYNQIEKYSHNGIFTGLFSLVQIFVAMTPEETVYFANPGIDGKFNKNYYFHWANFDNEPINHWKDIASSLISIPMAHQLIGCYTVADNTDGILKVMRSYQYYASNAISDKVAKRNWTFDSQLGGFIWHTTGSGKTLTSFKSAQLIAHSNNADKVVFLMDRIELGTQSLKEYRAFADETQSVQSTENTRVLITKLKSSDPADTLIVTSIQKMSNIRDEDDGLNLRDIEIMNSKRVVFIVDEAHRSTFGDMLITIKNTFRNAVFFGFTGTPIYDENQKKLNTTTTIFGDELHRYSVADGIRDKNVLGFDLYAGMIYKDADLRKAVALEKAKAKSEEEAVSDPNKANIYYKYMDSTKVSMVGYTTDDGKYVKGIEDYIPNAQYKTREYKEKVVEDIINNWVTYSRNGKFHAIFATSSIPEAIEYYRLLKEKTDKIKFTCLFDPNVDNSDGVIFKEDGLVEIIDDYNRMYNLDFELGTHAAFKRDIASRLAHKDRYKLIERTPEKQLDLLIVVDQMLTGYDSKWINTLYLDKMLVFENIIQAMSRTNRLFGPEKPFGIIKYYRRINTMKANIDKAVKIYSGDRPVSLFVEKLKSNLERMNYIFKEIDQLFINAKISNFEKLPEDNIAKAKFANLFKLLNEHLEASKIQGFNWDKLEYEFRDENTRDIEVVKMLFDQNTYLTLAQRYKELIKVSDEISSSRGEQVPFDIDTTLVEIDTGVIDEAYMNSRFKKYLKIIKQNDISEEIINQAKNELHKIFASLSQEQQKYANLILHDIEQGNLIAENDKTLRDYINQYQCNDQNQQIQNFIKTFGIDEQKLKNMMNMRLTKENINDYNRFDDLIKTVDKLKAKEYFEKKEGKDLSLPRVNIKTDKILREFILSGGFDL